VAAPGAASGACTAGRHVLRPGTTAGHATALPRAGHTSRGCPGPREAPGARRGGNGRAVVHRPAPPLRQRQHGRAVVGQSRGRVDSILAPARVWPRIGNQLLTVASQRTLYDTCRRHVSARQAEHPECAGHSLASVAKRAWPSSTGLTWGAQLTGTPGRGSHTRRSGRARGRAGKTTPHARQGVQPATDSRPGCTADSSQVSSVARQLCTGCGS